MDEGYSKPTGEHQKHRLASFTASRLNSSRGDERDPFLSNPTKPFSAGKKQKKRIREERRKKKRKNIKKKKMYNNNRNKRGLAEENKIELIVSSLMIRLAKPTLNIWQVTEKASVMVDMLTNKI